MLPIIVESKVHPFSPESHVESEVIIGGLLPGETGIAQRIEDDSRTEDIGHPSVELVGRKGLVCGKILVSRITYRATQLQQREEVKVLHERFLVDVPSRSNGPCVPEPVAGAEHRRSVKTVVEVEEVALSICITAIDIEAGGTLEAFTVVRRISDRIAVGK